MRSIRFVFNLIINVKKNTSFLQFVIFLFLLTLLLILGLFSLIKVVIPFTYIAL